MSLFVYQRNKKNQQPSTKKEPFMENTIINFRTKDWVKTEFMNLCKNDNTNATSVLNQFMRQTLKEAGVMAPSKTTSSPKLSVSSEWRQELITGNY